jgi:hypothetical protein
MTWIDDRIAEREKRERQQHNLAFQEAENIFRGLWSEIMRFVEEANTKGFLLTTNGSSFDRQISMPVPIPPGGSSSSPAVLHIKLERENGVISADGPGGGVHFVLDTRSDDVVCLTHDGREILIKDAAITILDPFLFRRSKLIENVSHLHNASVELRHKLYLLAFFVAICYVIWLSLRS